MPVGAVALDGLPAAVVRLVISCVAMTFTEVFQSCIDPSE